MDVPRPCRRPLSDEKTRAQMNQMAYNVLRVGRESTPRCSTTAARRCSAPQAIGSPYAARLATLAIVARLQPVAA